MSKDKEIEMSITPSRFSNIIIDRKQELPEVKADKSLLRIIENLTIAQEHIEIFLGDDQNKIDIDDKTVLCELSNLLGERKYIISEIIGKILVDQINENIIQSNKK